MNSEKAVKTALVMHYGYPINMSWIEIGFGTAREG